MNENNRIRVFDNGLVLLAEIMPWSESISFGALIPAGSANNSDAQAGLASLTCEATSRGAGGLGNREFLEALENLGVEASETTSQTYVSFAAAGLAYNWERTLELMAAQIRDPMFPEDEFEPCRQVQAQEIAALEDEPARRATMALGNIFFPSPWGRSSLGTLESLERLTLDDVRDFHRRYYRPNGTILAVAGRLDWDALQAKVEKLFGDWKEQTVPEIVAVEGTKSTSHIDCDSAQTHIALAFPSIPFGAPDYHRAWGGVEVLSGGMSSRLFTEVREKRGLCYTVFATYYTHRKYGGVLCYCGTTAERAQESLDTIVAEIDRLCVDPPTESELARMKIRSKSALTMQQESTVGRAGAIARDWAYLGKIRSMEEVNACVENLTCKSIGDFYAERGKRKFRLATLGPAPLALPEERLY